MNEATLHSIHSGFQTVNNTLTSAQKFPVIGIFASVAQFFVSTAELITTAAVAPIGRDSTKIDHRRDAAFKAHKYNMATEGLGNLVTSIVNVATLGFFVPLKKVFFQESSGAKQAAYYNKIAQEVMNESDSKHDIKSLFGSTAQLPKQQTDLVHDFIRSGDQEKLKQLLANQEISLNQVIAIALPYLIERQKIEGMSQVDLDACPQRAFQLLGAFRMRDSIDEDAWNGFRGVLYKYVK